MLAASLKGFLYYDKKDVKHETMRLAYATDASVYQEKPLAVAIPADVEDLRKLIVFARSHRVTLIPRTAGTSLAGQVVGAGIVVDVSRAFNAILELNVAERWVRVQPGVIRDDLNAYLKPYGLMYGPETSTANRAMIGGMVGNNSSGLHSIVWGDARQNLLSADMLLDDGSLVCFEALNEQQLVQKLSLSNREGDIYRRIHAIITDKDNLSMIRSGYPKKNVLRRNTGYAIDMLVERGQPFNLCQLLAGSEGTLGILTEVRLKLMLLPPKEVGLLCVHFTDLIESMRGNVVALRHGPAASELVDKYIMDFTIGHPTYQRNRFFIEGDPMALLIVEFRADTHEELVHKANALKEELQDLGLGYAYPLVTGPTCNAVWEVRKAGLGLIRNLPGESQPVNLIEDCAVAPEDLPAYVADVQSLLAAEGVHASYYAHAGAGELHIEPFINLKTAVGRQQFRNILEKATDLVLKYRGSLSGEHGDGRLRGEFIGKVLGKNIYQLLLQVKAIFDPHSVFNANKIVHTPPMDTSLRYEHGIKDSVIRTYFDFTNDEGILRLAEKCSGSGDCRKSEIAGGTMCPSFMATRDEKDTTRARANILRQFLTNSTKKNRFDHKEIKEVMDLCLSCKGCKSECPSSVDVTKMKAEFLQHYYDKNGSSFRAKVIANFSRSQQLASFIAPIYNGMISSEKLSSLIKAALGFAADRSLPKVGARTLKDWHKRRIKRTSDRKVYLFCDEFTNYNDTDIGITAIKLLEAVGYEVIIPEHVDSGRTYLSKGFVKKAKQLAKKNVLLLHGVVSADIPLVGIEPSAILTFRDEYIDLADPEWKNETLALSRNSLLIDEFLDRERLAGRIREDMFTAEPRNIKLHGHCYQKAFHLVGHTYNILSLPKNHEVEIIPSGCCGMAGSFGYEKEHYDVSMKVAELVLLPCIRETEVETLIVAPGTSCRHQIKDGVGRRSYHPIEVLFDALK